MKNTYLSKQTQGSKTLSKEPARLNEGAYYPTKNKLADMVKQFQAPVTRRAIRLGFLALEGAGPSMFNGYQFFVGKC